MPRSYADCKDDRTRYLPSRGVIVAGGSIDAVASILILPLLKPVSFLKCNDESPDNTVDWLKLNVVKVNINKTSRLFNKQLYILREMALSKRQAPLNIAVSLQFTVCSWQSAIAHCPLLTDHCLLLTAHCILSPFLNHLFHIIR